MLMALKLRVAGLPGCMNRSTKSRALARALSVAIPQEVYERLLSEMEAADG